MTDRENDALRATNIEQAAEIGILRTEKHADAEAIGSQAAEIERLRDSLREIAKPKVGPDFDWTDAEINKWRASWYREYENIARAALTGGTDQ